MNSFRRYARGLLAPACLILLASCGGGGDGGSSPAPAPPAPPPPAAQTITFADAGPIGRTYGDPVFTNAASGGAGTGAITYSSNASAVATVNATNGAVTIVGAGSAVITASKAADSAYLAATATYALQVAPAGQTISFANAGPIGRTYGDPVFANAASGGAGSGAITYSSNAPAVATVNATNGAVTIVGAGSAVITASKAADAAHMAATATYALLVAPASQSIAFASPGPMAKTYGDTDFANLAAGGAGNGAITYTSNSSIAAVDANSGLVNIVGAGSAVITASKAADATHRAASANYVLQIAPATQIIIFLDAGPIAKSFGDTAFMNLAAGGGGSGLISYTSGDSTIAAVEASTGIVSILGAGTVQIRADKAADANHLAAQATYTINIAPQSQSVSFANTGPISRTYGDPPFSNAALVIGGPGALTFASSDVGVAAIDATSGVVNISGAGTADITATKAGDANHTPAQASYRISVARAAQTIAFALPGPVDKHEGDPPFSNLATGGAGSGAVSYSSDEASVASVNASGLVTVGVTGTATITASKAASANHLAAQATYTINVTPRLPFEAPFTAWLSDADPAAVTLPAAAVGATFARAASVNCPDALSTACQSVTSTSVSTTSISDLIAGLGRTAQFWLQRGATTGRPVMVDSRRFNDAMFPPFELNGQLWLVGANRGEQTWSSSDGRAWILRSVTLPWTSRFGAGVVKFNDRVYFIGGRRPATTENFNDVWVSDDGLNWTRVLEHAPFAAREDHELVVFNGRMWLIGGLTFDGDVRYNDAWWSTDGVNWTQTTANAAFSPRHHHRVVAMNGRMWLVGGAGGQYGYTTFGDVWSSADGVSWRAEPTPQFSARRQVATLVHGNRWYVVGGYDGQRFGEVWWTEDGMQWQRETPLNTFGPRVNGFLIPYRGRVWLLGGYGDLRSTNMNHVWSTADFRDWNFEHTSTPFSQGRPGRLVSFDGKLWIIGQANNGPMNAWWSVDGNEWTQSRGDWAIPPRTGFTVAVNNGRLWLQGGYIGQDTSNRLNDVWSTADGETWTLATANAPFEPRYEHEMFAMNGKLFMVGGVGSGVRRGDVWSSTNGADWILETALAAFGERSSHQIVVLNGKAWLLGGLGNNPGATGQIWSSVDGVQWLLESTHLQATGRSRHRAVAHGNRMWITGGEMSGAHVPVGDTWYSSDGITWTEQLVGPQFSPRQYHGFASFDGKLWMYGGENVALENSDELFWSLDGGQWHYRYRNFIEVP